MKSHFKIEQSGQSAPLSLTDSQVGSTGLNALQARRDEKSPLDPERVRQLQRQFQDDLNPAAVIESCLVKQAATSAAFLELLDDWELAIAQAYDACEVPPSEFLLSEQAGLPDHWTLMMKINSLKELRRYSNLHWRRFSGALQEFRKLSQFRVSRLQAALERPEEEACLARLRQRFHHPDWSCPACGHQIGDWIDSHKCWECRHCHRQTSLRTGTLLENSPLPLSTWAYAYLLLQQNPRLPTRVLAEKLDMKRRDTVRKLRRDLLPHLDDPTALGGLVPC